MALEVLQKTTMEEADCGNLDSETKKNKETHYYMNNLMRKYSNDNI
jgi:hypothetical protein